MRQAADYGKDSDEVVEKESQLMDEGEGEDGDYLPEQMEDGIYIQ